MQRSMRGVRQAAASPDQAAKLPGLATCICPWTRVDGAERLNHSATRFALFYSFSSKTRASSLFYSSVMEAQGCLGWAGFTQKVTGPHNHAWGWTGMLPDRFTDRRVDGA